MLLRRACVSARPSMLTRSARSSIGGLTIVAPLSNQTRTSPSTETTAQPPAPTTPPDTSTSPNNATKMRRFWKHVQVMEKPGKSDGDMEYAVELDGRPLKTPAGTPLRLASRTLAHLVAAEWHTQERVLKPHALPLTSLVARGLDDLALSNRETRDKVIAFLLRYLDTDTIVYQQEFPESLQKLQQQHWTPLLQWAQVAHGVTIHTTTSLTGVQQPQATKDTLRKVVQQFDGMTLAGFERAVMQSKSFLIALALTQRHLSVEQAAKAARVETLAQTARWGEVEDTHDVEVEELHRQLASTLLHRLP